MPFSGGVYSAPSLPGSFNPAITGQNATPGDWNMLLTDLSTALSTCITRNGQSTITANIPMAGFVFTGLGSGAANGQSARYEQVVSRSYLAGCVTSNDGGTPNTVIDVTAGQAADVTTSAIMNAASGTINCATTGANGLDTGALGVSTWYHAFVIGKTDGTTAFLASTSPSAPTMPAGYTLKRRIGSFLTDGSSHIKAFTQTGNIFQWNTPIADFNASTIASATPTSKVMSVPTGVAGIRWMGRVLGNNTGTTGTLFSIYVYTPGKATTVASTISGGTTGTATTGATGSTYAEILTDTSAQITINATYNNTLTIAVETEGWIDQLGRFT